MKTNDISISEDDNLDNQKCPKCNQVYEFKTHGSVRVFERQKHICKNEDVFIEENVWICNQCNTPNFTQSVPKEEIEQELHSCINCGCFEFHLDNSN